METVERARNSDISNMMRQSTGIQCRWWNNATKLTGQVDTTQHGASDWHFTTRRNAPRQRLLKTWVDNRTGHRLDVINIDWRPDVRRLMCLSGSRDTWSTLDLFHWRVYKIRVDSGTNNLDQLDLRWCQRCRQSTGAIGSRHSPSAWSWTESQRQ